MCWNLLCTASKKPTLHLHAAHLEACMSRQHSSTFSRTIRAVKTPFISQEQQWLPIEELHIWNKTTWEWTFWSGAIVCSLFSWIRTPPPISHFTVSGVFGNWPSRWRFGQGIVGFGWSVLPKEVFFALWTTRLGLHAQNKTNIFVVRTIHSTVFCLSVTYQVLLCYGSRFVLSEVSSACLYHPFSHRNLTIPAEKQMSPVSEATYHSPLCLQQSDTMLAIIIQELGMMVHSISRITKVLLNTKLDANGISFSVNLSNVDTESGL